MRRNLERRLTSPEMIAIEKVGRSVTMASSNSPQVTFEADGVGETETTNRGRTITDNGDRDSRRVSRSAMLEIVRTIFISRFLRRVTDNFV